MKSCWLELTCEVPAGLSDTVAEQLAELSGCGVCTDNRNVDAFSPDDIPDTATVVIKVYFPDGDDPERVVSEVETLLAESAPGITIARPTVKEIRSEDWANNWKEHFRPLRVGRRILVVPTWEEPKPGPGDVVLRIDPGMAFGTGGHETTRLCLQILEELIDNAQSAEISVLDVGSGSGILAMAAALLGARNITAIDIDPLAVAVARENLAANGVGDRVECSTLPLSAVTGTFQIVLANILAEELVRMAPDLVAKLAAGGHLVLSGILAEKEALVISGFVNFPLELCAVVRDGEWIALQYQRCTP